MNAKNGRASALALIEERSQEFYEDAPCGYIFTYGNGIFIKSNRTFLNWLGYSQEELVSGLRFQDVLTVGCKIYYETNYAPLLRLQGSLREITLDLRTKDKRTIPVLINTTEVKNEAGEVVLVRSVLFDISDRRKYERELLAARLKAEKALAELLEERKIRERFVATLSHDLRAPITAINMSAQLILRKLAQPDAVRELAMRLVKSVHRADQMIQDLLDANRMSAGEKLRLKMTLCDFETEIKDVVFDLSVIHGDRFSLSGLSGIKGYCNAQGLKRIVENLCNNAVKYGSDESPIQIHFEKEGSHIVLSVHNKGNPISPHDQRFLFEQYKRTESAQTGEQRGWGLGLTLVRGVAEAHGGTVAVESSKEKGTTFTVTLPLDSRSEADKKGPPAF